MNTALHNSTLPAPDALGLSPVASESPDLVSVGLRDGQAVRRTFTTDYKRRVVAEYEAAPRGEKGAVLRREKLYDTQVSEWRQQVASGTLGRGSKAQKTGRPALTADQKRVRELEQQLAKTASVIAQKDRVIADRDAALEVLGKGVAFLEAVTSKNTK